MPALSSTKVIAEFYKIAAEVLIFLPFCDSLMLFPQLYQNLENDRKLTIMEKTISFAAKLKRCQQSYYKGESSRSKFQHLPSLHAKSYEWPGGTSQIIMGSPSAGGLNIAAHKFETQSYCFLTQRRYSCPVWQPSKTFHYMLLVLSFEKIRGISHQQQMMLEDNRLIYSKF